MSERLIPTPQIETREKKLFLQRLPVPLVAYFVNRLLGRNLTSEEQAKIKELAKRVVRGEHFSASKEVPPVYESQLAKIFCEGEENIPENGSTIVIGNHVRAGPLYDMGQYFEIARIVYDGRTAVEDEFTREAYAIMQRGLAPTVRIFGGRLRVPIPLARQLTGQFYELMARSVGWEIVDVPRFDESGQITHRQNLSRRAIERLEAGGAMMWFPQGKHTTNLEFPQKAGDWLFRLKDKDIQLIPLRVISKGKGTLFLLIGKPIHIQDLPLTDGTVNINRDFVQEHIAPLGRSITP